MRKFIQNESGAVTADWVLLTACIATLAVVVFMSIPPAVETVGVGIGDYVSDSQVGSDMFIQDQ